MRSIWFGDKRDLVKWSTLLHISKRFKLEQIIQICFLNPSDFHSITIDGVEKEVPAEVIKHFRDLRSVEKISDNVAVTVFDEPFNNRQHYLSSSLTAISKCNKPVCVFLDPDTGLKPLQSRANKTHVTETELEEYWKALEVGDVLVFYQHKPLMKNPKWIEERQEQFAKAIKAPLTDVKIAIGEKIANDVVFFYISKKTQSKHP